jgi:hypothetical protein
MDSLYSTLRSIRATKIGPFEIREGGVRDHPTGVFFDAKRKTLWYNKGMPGRFGPWHDTHDNTFLGVPILQLQYLNRERIRKRLETEKIVPIILQPPGTGTNVDLFFHIADGDRIHVVTYEPTMSDRIARDLSKLLKLINARRFDPRLFLRDVLPRINHNHRKETGQKMWFGMAMGDQNVLNHNTTRGVGHSSNKMLHAFLTRAMGLQLVSKHGIIVHNGMVCIYNSSLCDKNHVIMVSSRFVANQLSKVPPSKLRSVLRGKCVDINALIERQFPGSRVARASIAAKKGVVRLYRHFHKSPAAEVDIAELLRLLMTPTTKTNDHIDRYMPQPTMKKTAHDYEAYRRVSYETMSGIATKDAIDVGLITSARYGHGPLLRLIVSKFKQNVPIQTWEDVEAHAPPAFFKDIASEVQYTHPMPRVTGDQKKILLLVAREGISIEDATRRVKSGVRDNTYVFHNGSRKATLKLDRVQKIASILGSNNLHALASKILTKDDFFSKWYKGKNHLGIPIDEFVSFYRRHTNTGLLTSSRLNNRASNMAVIDYINERRRRVDEMLIGEYKGNKNVMGFASTILNKAYMKTGGNVQDRPLFTGLVGNPGDVRSPDEQYQASLRQNSKEDGCRKATPWETGDYSLSVHQSVAFAIINLRAMGHLLDVPGLFCYYSVGAGKTVIVLSSIVAYWNTDKSIIPASVRSNSRGNDLKKMGEEASLYFRSFRCTLGIRTVHNKQYPFLEYPFIDAETAEDQLRMRLKFGHAMAGHPGAHALADTHLLNSYATALTVLRNSTGKTRAVKGRRVTQHAPVPRIENTVFVLDEIQLLFNPPRSEAHLQKEYDAFKSILLQRDVRSCFTVALTATPGDTRDEIMKVYTMVMAKTTTKIPRHATLSAYVTGDTRYFPNVVVENHCIKFPDATKRRLGPTDPDALYFRFYLKLLAQREVAMHGMHRLAATTFRNLGYGAEPTLTYKKKTKGDDYINQSHRANLTKRGKLKDQYYRHAKIATEFLRITETLANPKRRTNAEGFNDDNNDNLNSITETKTMMDVVKEMAKMEQYAHRMIIDRRKDKISVNLVSPKISAMIKTFVKKQGVHFVYVENKSTMRLIGHILATVHGWDLYHADTKENRKGGRNDGDRKPVFGYIKSFDGSKLVTEFWDAGKGRYVRPIGTSAADATSLTRAIQSDHNLKGEKCKVIIATGDLFKGVNTKAVRHLHIVSPMAKWGDLLQLVGRATRFKSHCGLPKNQRDVTVHRWSLQPPDDDTALYPLFPDDYVLAHSFTDYQKSVGELNNEIVESSIPTLLSNTAKKQKDLEQKLSFVCDQQLTIEKMVLHAKKMEKEQAKRAEKEATKQAATNKQPRRNPPAKKRRR